MSLVHLYESKAVRLCSFVGVSKEFYREFAAVLRMAHARAYSGVSGATVCARDVAAGATGVANHYDLRPGELRSGARLETLRSHFATSKPHEGPNGNCATTWCTNVGVSCFSSDLTFVNASTKKYSDAWILGPFERRRSIRCLQT